MDVSGTQDTRRFDHPTGNLTGSGWQGVGRRGRTPAGPNQPLRRRVTRSFKIDANRNKSSLVPHTKSWVDHYRNDIIYFVADNVRLLQTRSELVMNTLWRGGFAHP